jgi:hypothetical protein
MRKDRPFRAVPIQHSRQFRRRRLLRDRRVTIGRIGMWFALAALVGGGVGYLSAQGSSIRDLTARLLPDKSFSAEANVWVYYADCEQARAAGRVPIQAGEPGYRTELDADGDGTACEPYPGHRSHRRRSRFYF